MAQFCLGFCCSIIFAAEPVTASAHDASFRVIVAAGPAIAPVPADRCAGCRPACRIAVRHGALLHRNKTSRPSTFVQCWHANRSASAHQRGASVPPARTSA